MPEAASCVDCARDLPPRGQGLDRLVSRLEGAATSRRVEAMVDLHEVLGVEAARGLPASVVDFYRDPTRCDVRAALTAGRWSLLCLRMFALFSRQSLVVRHAESAELHPVCQWVYRDRRARVRWDRFSCIRGTCVRLFTARMAAEPGHVTETFVLFGLPFALRFRAALVESGVAGQALADRGLELRLVPRWISPLSWLLRVRYTTSSAGDGLVTHGDFRLPLLGLRMRTRFVIDAPRRVLARQGPSRA